VALAVLLGHLIEPDARLVAGSTALFVSETESAVQWGRDLFEALWADSDPLGPYVEREYPELVE